MGSAAAALIDVDCGDLAPSRACGNARPVKILSGVERDSRPQVSGSETGVPRGRSGPPVDGGVGPPHSTYFCDEI